MGNVFSCKGIKLVVDFFLKRGHTQIKAMLPRFRRGTSDHDCPSTSPEILDELEQKGHITYTPSRFVKNKLIIPYGNFLGSSIFLFKLLKNLRNLTKMTDSFLQQLLFTMQLLSQMITIEICLMKSPSGDTMLKRVCFNTHL